jgi:hydrogenase nickel incorporation protein HypA/HybF
VSHRRTEEPVHELSLCSAIADTVISNAGGRTVSCVRVRIGAYRQVVPDTLAFCWEMQTAGTELAECELVLTTVSAVVACNTCGEPTTLDSPILLCGSCDGADVRLVAGEEFLIESIDVERIELTEEMH